MYYFGTGNDKTEYNAHTLQKARVTITPPTTGSNSLNLTDADITSGGLVIDRYSISNTIIELGSAVAAEMKLTLDNYDRHLDDFAFAGAECFVEIKPDAANTSWMPMGYFTIDKAPKKLAKLSISALDRMVQFDKVIPKFDNGQWAVFADVNHTVKGFIQRCCENCNVPLYDPSSDAHYSLNGFPNINLNIPSIPVTPDEDVTYRQIIAWCAELLGACAFIDWNGNLRFGWYSKTAISGEDLGADSRYTSDLEDNAVTVTGIQITDDEEYKTLVGTNDYVLNIEGNPLANLVADKATALQNIVNADFTNGRFTYTPFTATVTPRPYLYPLDAVNYIDRDDNPVYCIVSNVTFTLNSSTVISGKGETEKEHSYAQANPLTSREKAIIREIQRANNAVLNSRVNVLLSFNALMANAMGVYTTTAAQDDGSEILYLHDADTLANSKTVYRMSAEGFAFTNNYNGEQTVWQGGLSNEGNLIVNKINATGIDVADGGENNVTAQILPGIFKVLWGDTEVLSIAGDTSQMSRLNVTDGLQIGRIKFVPSYDALTHEMTGTDILFL